MQDCIAGMRSTHSIGGRVYGYKDIFICIYYRRERITLQALWTLDNNHNFRRVFAIPTIFEGFFGIPTILVGLLIFNPTQKNLPVSCV
jgi:hypothetical protein